MQLQVFPNPCSEIANLIYSVPDIRGQNEIALFDLHGRKVKEIPLSVGGGLHQISLDVSDLTNGLYFAELLSGDRQVMQKLGVVK